MHGALKAPNPACMLPVGQVMEAQRTDANHATPFFPLWRPSTTLTGIGICLAMLSWPLVSVALRPSIATPVASDPKAVVEEQHGDCLEWKTALWI